jgi:hypothetical protein
MRSSVREPDSSNLASRSACSWPLHQCRLHPYRAGVRSPKRHQYRTPVTEPTKVEGISLSFSLPPFLALSLDKPKGTRPSRVPSSAIGFPSPDPRCPSSVFMSTWLSSRHSSGCGVLSVRTEIEAIAQPSSCLCRQCSLLGQKSPYPRRRRSPSSATHRPRTVPGLPSRRRAEPPDAGRGLAVRRHSTAASHLLTVLLVEPMSWQ